MPSIPLHISSLFIALVFAIGFLIIIAVHACNNRLNLPDAVKSRNLLLSILIILGWLTFTLIIGVSGFLADYTSTPPKILFVALPPFLLALALPFSKKFNALIAPLDNFWFIYPQSFRILMEFILWLLYRYKVIPVQMTFEGRNYDIIIGLTAPIIVYYCFNRKIWPPKIALVWNIAGLILLGQAVTLAILSMPYSFRVYMNEPANTIAFHFPFIWLPAFVVPFAFFLHLISIKRLLANK